MRTIRTLLVVPAAAAAALAATAAPASAACYGTQNIGVVCSTVNVKGTLYEDCVYTGGSSCTDVRVPGPDGCITGGGTFWNLVPICL